MVAWGSYVAPGVYVGTTLAPTVAPTGVAPTVVCLVGPGVGYHTYAETVALASDPITLTQQGIDPDSITVTGFVTDPNDSSETVATTFTPQASGASSGGDYTVTQTTPSDGDSEEAVTTLAKTSASTIEDAYPQVTISYHYADADYYAVNYFTEFTSFTDTYGSPLDRVTGEIASPLSLAAQFAIQNGANQLYAIATKPGDTTLRQFADAYDALSVSNADVNIVVPLWQGVTDGAALSGLLYSLSSTLNQDAKRSILRMGIAGFDKGYTPVPTDLATLAQSISSERMVIAWPNQLSLYNGVANKTTTVDGYYLAAAYAGILSAQTPQTPLTYKSPQGFAGLPAKVTKGLSSAIENTLAQAGVALTEPIRSGRLRVRQGLTTDYSGGVLTREISLVRQSDALYELIQTSLDAANLIGTPITEDTDLAVKGIVAGALEDASSSGLIVGYTGLAVRQQTPPSGDPTIIEVQFAYQPTFPLNYIVVNFSVDLQTGIQTVNSTITGSSSATNATGVGAAGIGTAATTQSLVAPQTASGGSESMAMTRTTKSTATKKSSEATE